MSKLNQEELLERVGEWKILIDRKLDCHWYKRDEQAYGEIVARLKKPEVTEEFIRKWTHIFKVGEQVLNWSMDITFSQLSKMLTEAGVSITVDRRKKSGK